MKPCQLPSTVSATAQRIASTSNNLPALKIMPPKKNQYKLKMDIAIQMSRTLDGLFGVAAGGSVSTVQSKDSKADIDDNDGAVANSNK